MKRILLLIALVASFSAKSQTVDSTKCGFVVHIQPIKVNFNDSLKSQYITARIVNDDMRSSAIFVYQLLDSNCTCTMEDNVHISGGDYENWSGSNAESYLYITNKIGVTIKEE